MRAPWHPRRKAAIDKMTPSLRFELAVDSCCVLCNPVALADYETRCVRVVSSQAVRTIAVCEDCVCFMAAVLQVRPPRTPRKKAAH